MYSIPYMDKYYELFEVQIYIKMLYLYDTSCSTEIRVSCLWAKLNYGFKNSRC